MEPAGDSGSGTPPKVRMHAVSERGGDSRQDHHQKLTTSPGLTAPSSPAAPSSRLPLEALRRKLGRDITPPLPDAGPPSIVDGVTDSSALIRNKLRERMQPSTSSVDRNFTTAINSDRTGPAAAQTLISMPAGDTAVHAVTRRDGARDPDKAYMQQQEVPSARPRAITVRRCDHGSSNKYDQRDRTEEGPIEQEVQRNRSGGGSSCRSGRSRRETWSSSGTQPPPRLSTPANKSPMRSKSRGPLSRYLLLSTALIMAGLAIRYLWRQLAGLAGALLILAASRRSGKEASKLRHKKNGTTTSSVLGTDTSPATDSEMATLPADAVTRKGGEAEVEVVNGGGPSTGEEEAPAFGGAFADSPDEMRRYWEDGGPECAFVVRGHNYMSDRKKVRNAAIE